MSICSIQNSQHSGETLKQKKVNGYTERSSEIAGALERVREVLEDLSREKGKVLEFKPHATKFAVPDLPE